MNIYYYLIHCHSIGDNIASYKKHYLTYKLAKENNRKIVSVIHMCTLQEIQEYINSVSNQVQEDRPQTKVGGFQSFVQGATSPFLRTAATGLLAWLSELEASSVTKLGSKEYLIVSSD